MSKFMDPLQHLPEVKTVKPITGTPLSTLIQPGDLVVSCQPDGRLETRPAGAEGDYERCRVRGTMATFRPVAGKSYTFAFADVEGL